MVVVIYGSKARTERQGNCYLKNLMKSKLTTRVGNENSLFNHYLVAKM